MYRIYRELELNSRIKPQKGLKQEKPEPLAVSERPNETWSMDFMADQLTNGRSFRPFNVLMTSTVKGWVIEVDVSLPSERVTRALDRIIEWRGKPRKIRCWAEKRDIQLDYIRSGKPRQNAYVERYNRTVRHEWREINDFATIEEAQLTSTQWLWIYNNERPNMALGVITPAMKFAEAFKLKLSLLQASVKNGRITFRKNVMMHFAKVSTY